MRRHKSAVCIIYFAIGKEGKLQLCVMLQNVDDDIIMCRWKKKRKKSFSLSSSRWQFFFRVTGLVGDEGEDVWALVHNKRTLSNDDDDDSSLQFMTSCEKIYRRMRMGKKLEHWNSVKFLSLKQFSSSFFSTTVCLSLSLARSALSDCLSPRQRLPCRLLMCDRVGGTATTKSS